MGVPQSRPDQFVGLRFDTSTTSPSINDSFFTFEAVANPTSTAPGRNNTQGATSVTSIVPTPGVWHTLQISCVTAGQVSFSLDNSASFTTAVPIYSFTTSVGALGQNGAAHLTWTPSGTTPPQGAWNTGTNLTVSGFGGSLSGYNGTWQLVAGEQNAVGFDAPLIASGVGTGVTLSGFPSMIPVCIMGNDDTASPTEANKQFIIDYFSLVWNA